MCEQQATRIVLKFIPFEYHYPVNLERNSIKEISEKIIIRDKGEVDAIDKYLSVALKGRSENSVDTKDYRMYCEIYSGASLKKSFYFSSTKLLVVADRLFRDDNGLLEYILNIPKVKTHMEKLTKYP